ncbi:MAG: glycosyltransferase [Bacteroidales bacterium]|nr:glycosyltransferase [Bacteroidales bacterium]
MSDIHLHIVSFDVPLPADYGGVIDVYYKALELTRHDVKIHLHCFEYGRGRVEALERTFYKVHYYKRDVSKTHLFKSLPYIVSTRTSDDLVNTLLLDDYPILMEGLHTTFLLKDKRLKNRKMLVRAHNIEHDYYLNLSRAETVPFKKYFFYNESIKLARYEKILTKADHILAISSNDYNYFTGKFHNVELIPAFHPYHRVESIPGKGNYILYHGKLSVPENANAVRFLLTHVFNNLDVSFVIAGSNPPSSLVNLVYQSPNAKLIVSPDDEELSELIRNAHINVAVTFQSTGLKLKLLNSLYNGRFCLVNSYMLSGSRLDSLCVVQDDPEEMKHLIVKLLDEEFTQEMIVEREKVLSNFYNNGDYAKQLILMIS